jgi:hypothetical protein
MSKQPDFPPPVRVGGRLFFDRHEIENHKRALMGLSPLGRDESTPIQFATAEQVTSELQIDRRTLGRRVRGRIRE